VECHTYESFDVREPVFYAAEMLQEQSGNVSVSTTPASNQETVVGFDSVTGGFTTTVASRPDSTSDLVDSINTDIMSFLARPVIIGTELWEPGSSNFYYQINPWKELLRKASVKSKTQGYDLFRAKLHVRITCTGSSYFAGRAIASYRPVLGDEDFLRTTSASPTLQNLFSSQRMHVFLNPTQSQGGDLVAPFFFEHDYIELNKVDTSLQPLGELTITSLAPLVNYLSGADAVATIRVYAWFEDVQMKVATYVQQSGTEGGLVSKVATDVARKAGTLSSAPVIGPYAKATQMGASAVADVASIFGYSRPRNLIDSEKMAPEFVGNLTNSNTKDQSVVLALDGRQETSIDPRTVGLDGQDDMAFSRIVTIPSFIGNMTIPKATSADRLLAIFPVMPSYYFFSEQGRDNAYTLTASAAIARAFVYWRGSIKFRFVFNTTNFHRGRVAFRFEPDQTKALSMYNLANGSVSGSTYLTQSQTQTTHIVDLADKNDFSVCVGWAKGKPYLRVPNVAPTGLGTSSNWLNIKDATGPNVTPTTTGWQTDVCNGYLMVSVLDPVVYPGPLPINDIYCQVYVSMCDDFEFGKASGERIQNLSTQTFELQSGVEGVAEMTTVDEPQGGDEIAAMYTTPTVPELSPIFMGETIGSIRTLVKRFSHTFSYSNPNLAADKYVRLRVILWQFIGFFGPTNFGLPGNRNVVDVLGREGTSTQAYDFNATGTTFMHYFMPAFAGWKGSTRLKVVPWGGPRTSNIYSTLAIGLTNSPQTASFGYQLIPAGSDYHTAASLWRRGQWINSSSGISLTQKLQKAGVEVEFPWQRSERMERTGLMWGRATSTYARAIISEDIYVDRSFDYSGMDIFTAAGEDFTLFWWQGMPTLYRKDDIPESRPLDPWRAINSDNALTS
jgi:hypothetical protein